MMKKISYLGLSLLFFVSCSKQELTEKDFTLSNGNPLIKESVKFEAVGSIDLGSTGASEISAFDPLTNKLFVVKNDVTPGRIEVLNLSNPSNPAVIGNIVISPFGVAVNSVSVSNGMLAAAIESSPKQNPGRIVVFRTTDYAVLANQEVGALPDMVTFSPDGKFIISANEGEPNAAYTIDPIGSLSILEVAQNFAVTTLDFSGFASQEAELMAKGLRKFGPNASFAQDMEPEYVAVSANSKTAWVSLQENNAIASIDLSSKTIEKILPLGFKDYNLSFNAMDPSNADGIIGNLNPWPVKGMYLPDAIAVMPQNGVPFVYSANEGDARDYTGFKEEFILSDKPATILDETAFPSRDQLRLPANMGNLKLTRTLGDTDGDGDFDELYSFGSRSFSVWNGQTGQLVYDSRNELDKQALAANIYADGRSDDKSTEPEGVTIGRVGNKTVLFLALERVDAVAVYDVTNAVKPSFLQMLLTGDAPEGILFVEASKSPTGKSLLIVSSEGDGTVKIYTTENLVQ
jgi:hypothetical protein